LDIVLNIEKNIKIFDTSYEGYGVGKISTGQVVFIPYAVTGDILDVFITESKKNYLFGKIQKIIFPSEYRINPACPYFEICGGCQFMHISYENQIKVKKNIINNAFRNFENFEINDTLYAETERYRLRAKFKLFQKKLGFFSYKSNEFVKIDDCLLIKQSIVEKAKEFSKFYTSEICDFYIIENTEEKALAYLPEIDYFEQNIFDGIRFKNKISGLKSIYFETSFGKIFTGFTSFFQSNRFLLDKFQSLPTAYIDKKDRILELYCGSGFFSAMLSSKAERVVSIDFEGESIQLGYKIKKDNLKFLKGNIDKTISNFKFDFNTLFLDPPRSGLSKNLIKFIKNKLPEKIIYISCNPITMARDIARLRENYTIKNFTFIDMFPHTYHIESMAILEIK
jgi:23S rRNA (uracil1939-C5)-methyltransferase